MPKTLYLRKQAAAAHDGEPSDYGTRLSIGGIETSIGKYTQYFDDGDNDQEAAWDYVEWSIGAVSYEAPSDWYESAVYTYGEAKLEYSVWSSVTVPDTFTVPGEIDVIGGGPINPPPPPNRSNGWSFDWSGAGSDSAESLLDNAIWTGVNKIAEHAADTLMPQYADAIKSAVSAGIEVGNIQANGAKLIADLMTNFDTISPEQADLKINGYVLSSTGTLVTSISERTGLSNDVALSFVQGMYEGTGITIQNFVPGQTHSGSIKFGGFQEYELYAPSSQVALGTTDSDHINGSIERDILGGGPGDDIFNPGPGGDLVVGGDGLDTVNIDGVVFFPEVLVNRSGDVIIVQDPSSDAVFDTLVNVERISFFRGTVAFDTMDNAGQMYRLYQAAFARDPDKAGLGYWIREFDQGQKDLAGVAYDFLISEEFKATYGSSETVSDEAFLNLLYNNVLGRDADAAGKAYWMDRLSSGFARERVLASFSESDENRALVATEISNGIWYI